MLSHDKALKKFLFELIDRTFLSQITWSGRTKFKSSNRESKIAFKAFVNIHKLLIDLVKKKDARFNKEIFEDLMINKILKYAYR